MFVRTLTAISALLLASGALVGVGFSGATWTRTTSSPLTVAASSDWTPPTVTVSALPAGIFGTVAVTATATDARSAIGSVTLEYAPAGGSTWTAISSGCTAASGPSPLAHTCQWDTTGVTDGDYLVRARTTDAAAPTPYGATSAPVPTQVANATSVVLTTVPSPLRGTVTLTAGFLQPVSGNTKLTIEYLVGATWTQIGTCTAANVQSFTCGWDTAAYPNGTYHLRARADKGSVSWTDEQSGVVVDNQPPTVTSFTVPSGVLSGSVPLAATAADALTSVASVRFDYQLGTGPWASCGTDASVPYTCNLDTAGLATGSYTFRAVAADAPGNASAPATQTRTVSNAPAAVSITSPAAGATVSGAAVPVTASASSDRGVASVRIESRSTSGTFSEVCTDLTAPYSCPWNASALADGSHELRAVLVETYGGGSTTSAPVPVTVNNSVGSVALTSPLPGSTVSGSAVSLAATASAGIPSTVTSVTFEAGPVGGPYTQVCTDAVSPYACTWNSTTVAFAATYALRAVMLQSNGSTYTTSASVKVDNVTGSVALSSPSANARLSGVVAGTISVTSNAVAASARIIATPTGLAGPAVSIPCTAGSGTPPSAVGYTCSWDTSAIANTDYTLQAEATLANGTVVVSGAVSVLVRNLHAQDVQMTTTASSVDGNMSNKDALVLTFSDQVALSSLKAGFTGTRMSVAVTLRNEAGGDRLVFAAGVNLGSVKFTQNYVSTDYSFNVDMTASTLAGSPTVVTLAFPNAGNGTMLTDTSQGSMIWTPSVLAADTATPAVACSAAAVTEPGLLDGEF